MDITPCGARRRTEALFSRGWSPATLAGQTGLPEALFRAGRDDLAEASPDLLAQMGRAYEQLWNTGPPRRTEAEHAAAEVFTRQALLVGWAPPMAWDDDQIDRENGSPAPGWRRPEHQPQRTRHDDLMDDIAWLRATGYRDATPAELAARLGLRREAVARALVRDSRRKRDGQQQAERALEAG